HGGAPARHRGIARASERPPDREQHDRLDQVGLSRSVLAQDKRGITAQVEPGFPVVPEFAELDGLKAHAFPGQLARRRGITRQRRSSFGADPLSVWAGASSPAVTGVLRRMSTSSVSMERRMSSK